MENPTPVSVGEILYPDGYRILVPQPVKFQELPTGPLNDFYITLPGLPSSAEVQEYAEKHADSNAPQRTVPVWAVVCVCAGLTLLAASALLAVVVAILAWNGLIR